MLEERPTGRAVVPAVQAAALAATGLRRRRRDGRGRLAPPHQAGGQEAQAARAARRDRVVELVPDRRPPAAPRLTCPRAIPGRATPGPARSVRSVLVREVVRAALGAVPARRRRRWTGSRAGAATGSCGCCTWTARRSWSPSPGRSSPRGRRRRRPRARGSRGCASRSGIDDDLADFHARFRDDPLIGRAVRARPWLRVRRNPDPWETLMWAITEQLIDMPRAIAIQRRMIARLRAAASTALRDSPDGRDDRRPARPPSSRPAACTPSARWRCAAARARWPRAASRSRACRAPSRRRTRPPRRPTRSSHRRAALAAPRLSVERRLVLVREVVRASLGAVPARAAVAGRAARGGAGTGSCGCCTWAASRSWSPSSGHGVRGARGASEAAAREGIARMRFATGHRRRPRRRSTRASATTR